MTGTRKVNKDMSFGNNLILENDLGLLSVSIYTELNGIVLILGFGFFISLVNCCLILQLFVSLILSEKLFNVHFGLFVGD